MLRASLGQRRYPFDGHASHWRACRPLIRRRSSESARCLEGRSDGVAHALRVEPNDSPSIIAAPAAPWYALRWKIEVFHKILKSGCKAEESKLRTAQRLANLVSVFCILSWRVFWMTMLNRSTPDALPTLALTVTEIAVLDRLVNDRSQDRRKTLSHYLIKIARLGGYLARANDPPPGNTVMWRGLSRLTDIALGAMVGAEIVGN